MPRSLPQDTITADAEDAGEQLGKSGGTPRDEKDAALDRIVVEGRPRLHRAWYDQLATGTVAGIEIGFGILVLLTVREATGSVLLAALAFSIGFVALLLGHSELFTEGFLVPVTVVVAGEGSVLQLAKMWGLTLVGNLVGGWVTAWLIVTALPGLQHVAVQSGAQYAQAGISLRTFCLAVLAGGAITLLTRMQNGTEDMTAKILAAIGIAFVIVGGGLFHSVLDSILVFAALHSGAPFGYLDWLGWFAWSVLGNLVGGLGLITVLRLVRSQERLTRWRRAEHESADQ